MNELAAQTTNPLMKSLTLTIPASSLKQAVQKKLQQIAKTSSLPGFRPGKIPMKLVENTHRQSVTNELLESLIKEQFLADVEKNKWRMANEPKLNVVSMEPEITVDASFEILPQIQPDSWPRIALKRWQPEISEQDISEQIAKIQLQQAEYVVEDKAAELGDRLCLDFNIKVDDEPLEGGAAEKGLMVLDEAKLLPDFVAGLRSSKAEQTGQFEFTFPADYFEAKCAGKLAKVDFKVYEVARSQKPELTDAWVEKLSLPEVKTVAQLQQTIKQQMLEQAEIASKSYLRFNLFAAWRSFFSFPLPECMVEREINYLREVEKNKAADANDKSQPEAEQTAWLQKVAQKRVINSLLVHAYGQANKLQADKESIMPIISEWRQQSRDPKLFDERLKNDKALVSQIYEQAFEETVINHLFKNYCDWQDLTVPWSDYFNKIEAELKHDVDHDDENK